VKEKKSFTCPPGEKDFDLVGKKTTDTMTTGERKQVARKKERVSVNPPGIPEVKAFFTGEQSTDTEALKFFNHYTANGWTIGCGKADMLDWQASARKWILNITSREKTGNNQEKNYNEPL